MKKGKGEKVKEYSGVTLMLIGYNIYVAEISDEIGGRSGREGDSAAQSNRF